MECSEQVDRKDDFYQNWGFAFPKPDDVNVVLYDTVLDAELVIDVDRETGKVRCFFSCKRRRPTSQSISFDCTLSTC